MELAACMLGGIEPDFGAYRRAKGFAAASAVLVSIPAIFYQASNTKNDILVGFLLICLVWLTEEAVKKRVITWPLAILTGICVGCALMAKGTSLIFLSVLFPFLLVFRLLKNDVQFKIFPVLTSGLFDFFVFLNFFAPPRAVF
jgi:4-amino-4-deoxy-L-arabinose transferase-like glycosyltransferase